MATTVDDKSGTVDFSANSSYSINGGALSLSDTSPIFGFNTNSSSSATVGSAGGEFDISLNSSIFSGFSGSRVYNLNITNTPPSNFLITFALNGNSETATAKYDGSQTTLTFTVTGGLFLVQSSITINVTMPGNPYGFRQGRTVNLDNGNYGDGNGNGQICYLPGTLIETPLGRVPVETLSQGDEVYVFDGQKRYAVPLKWVGRKTVSVNSVESRPVRIKANALGDNVPFKDLLVTPEHCLFLNGAFVPARMLVNNKSIIVDEQDQFEIVHIETEHHAVVMADGALAESYLDTGNRRTFQSQGKIVFGGFERLKTWEEDAAAVLETRCEFVQPLHKKFSDRADALGFRSVVAEQEWTHDPELRVVCEDGMVVAPVRQVGNRYVFQLPSGISRVGLQSRTCQPKDTIGPFVDDRRHLGVLIGEVTLFASEETKVITSHLEEEAALGWHGIDEVGCRWTKGMAVLSLGQRLEATLGILSVEVLTGGPYRVEKTEVYEERGVA
nr:Hint domain-containing protein [uncultured Neokomagataea sp.]